MLALTIWIVSVLVAVMVAWRLPAGLGGSGRAVLACGWAGLLAGMGAAFAAQQEVSRWVGAAQASRATAADLPESGLSLLAPWLVLVGLALVAASVLMAL